MHARNRHVRKANDIKVNHGSKKTDFFFLEKKEIACIKKIMVIA